jgi:nucleotide-binding universal stress UspA family protein
MLTNLLVTLDGSAQAERGARVAGAWVGRTRGHLTFFHVLEPDAPARVHGEPHLQKLPEALAYLQEAAKRLIPSQVEVSYEVDPHGHEGVVSRIAERMARGDHDLLVMSPHGGTNLRRILHGSLPERIADKAICPLLIVRGSYLGVGENPFGTVVIPDDGDSRHEDGWQTCVDVLRLFNAPACLVAVAEVSPDPRSGRGGAALLQPSASRGLTMLQAEALRNHLATHRNSLISSGVTAEAHVLEGEPTLTVAEFSLERRAGLVILRTHSRIGLAPRMAGGFAAQFLAKSKTSVLVLPIPLVGD